MANQFTPFQVKQPKIVKQLSIGLNVIFNIPNSIFDEDGNETVTYETKYNATYSVLLHDEDGNVVNPTITSGDLEPYLNSGQIIAIKALIDAVVIKAKKLLP